VALDKSEGVVKGRVPQVPRAGFASSPGAGHVQPSQQLPRPAVYALFVPRGLHRFHQSKQSHFLTFSCYRRQPFLDRLDVYDLFLHCLEDTRRRVDWRIYAYVVMPEHVHLLLSEPDCGTLADAMRDLKLSFRKRVPGKPQGPFWQKRYHDRNVRSEREFGGKLRYIHRNPVKRGLVKEAGDWKWSSFRHYTRREKGAVQIESEWTARDRETGGLPRIFLYPR